DTQYAGPAISHEPSLFYSLFNSLGRYFIFSTHVLNQWNIYIYIYQIIYNIICQTILVSLINSHICVSITRLELESCFLVEVEAIFFFFT
ncbi:hypothetical protein ACJX0J_014892, partial [Zea mays]